SESGTLDDRSVAFSAEQSMEDDYMLPVGSYDPDGAGELGVDPFASTAADSAAEFAEADGTSVPAGGNAASGGAGAAATPPTQPVRPSSGTTAAATQARSSTPASTASRRAAPASINIAGAVPPSDLEGEEEVRESPP